MNVLDRNAVRQPIALLSDGLDALPNSVTDLDVTDLAAAAGEMLETVAAGGTKTAFRSARAVYRHRRGVGFGLLVVALLLAGGMLVSKRQSNDEVVAAG